MDVKIYLIVLGLLVIPLFYPQYNIIIETPIDYPAKLNDTFDAGDVVVLNPTKAGEYFVNGKAFDNLRENLKFGVVGLNKRAHSVFTYEKYNNPFFALHNEVEFSRKHANLNLRKIKSGSKLRLPASVIKKLRSGPKSLRRLQAEEMRRVLRTKPSQPLDFKCWELPVRSKTVSRFAAPRTLPRGRSYYHTGVDLRAWTGTKILATGPGKVVFAKENIVPGKTVVIDHGGSVFSRYLHLSDFKVNLGDQVKTGDLLGLSGSTGRVEAPHLHWEILWKGSHANPKKFLQFLGRFCDPK